MRKDYRKPWNALKNADRNLLFLVIVYVFIGIILIRLFSLQVLQYSRYEAIATKEHYGYSELPARRGEIFIKDYASNDAVRIATNITLNLLFADPTLIKNKKLVADRIAPLIFNLDQAKKDDIDRVKTETTRAQNQEELDKIKPLKDEELYQNFYNELLEKISEDIRPKIILTNEMPPEKLNQIATLKLSGIEIEKNTVVAYPLKIDDQKATATILAEHLEMPELKLETLLKGANRYVILQKKIPSETTIQIKKIIDEDKKNYSGLALKEEYYRYYPEGQLAANVLGFVDSKTEGIGGIEEKFNSELQGKKGVFQTQIDSIGRQITVGDTLLEPAIDGQNIVLTLDRSIQLMVEKKLARAVKDYKADAGQVIVMNPKTGEIIAMANYPSFDPNNYSEAYEKEEVNLSEEDKKNLIPISTEPNTFWFYRNIDTEDKVKIFKEISSDNKEIYKKYKNNVGPEVYQNKPVSENYEPGSVYKTITMSIGIDDKDVTPTTALNDPGFIEVEIRPGVKKKITNVSPRCTGYITMRDVIANSCNTGISFVADKMGSRLFYSYMKKFGFGERTEIEFENESPGQIQSPPWAESELYNHAFGQGISVTLIQMATALSTIANKGVMMQPHIVDSIDKGQGKIVKTEPSILGTIISADTANSVTGMMVAAVEDGVAKAAALPDHFIAGKTGTSQIFERGKYVDGYGKFVGSMGGFGPIDDPKFVILVKLDRPRTNKFADGTAGILFRDIASYLFDYYSLPPDKKKS